MNRNRLKEQYQVFTNIKQTYTSSVLQELCPGGGGKSVTRQTWSLFEDTHEHAKLIHGARSEISGAEPEVNLAR